MSVLTTARPIGTGALRFNPWRAAGVLGAVLGAVAVWAVVVPLLGIHLAVRFGSGPIQSVGIWAVVISALVGSLGGWGVLGIVERIFRQGLVIWTGLAIAGLLASLSLPLYAGTTLSTKIALPLMHLAVGVVLIPMLRRGATAEAAQSKRPRANLSPVQADLTRCPAGAGVASPSTPLGRPRHRCSSFFTVPVSTAGRWRPGPDSVSGGGRGRHDGLSEAVA